MQLVDPSAIASHPSGGGSWRRCDMIASRRRRGTARSGCLSPRESSVLRQLRVASAPGEVVPVSMPLYLLFVIAEKYFGHFPGIEKNSTHWFYWDYYIF